MQMKAIFRIGQTFLNLFAIPDELDGRQHQESYLYQPSVFAKYDPTFDHLKP